MQIQERRMKRVLMHQEANCQEYVEHKEKECLAVVVAVVVMFAVVAVAVAETGVLENVHKKD